MHRLIAASCVVVSTVFAIPPDLGRGRPGDVLHVHHAPDPVNVRTGNFYLPFQDYYQTCFTLPTEVYRSYNSFWTENGPFGKGWTFNFDTQVKVNPEIGVQVIEADGFINSYQPAESGKGSSGVIDRILKSKKDEDAKKSARKSDAFYDEYKGKLQGDREFFKRQKAIYLPGENLLSPKGKYVSTERGRSTIDQTRDGFTRVLETGRIEIFDKNGRLVRVEDRNRNSLRLAYNSDGRLARITDSCDQSISFKFNKGGRIEKITDTRGRAISYAYDAGDFLVSMTPVDGQTMQYSYDNLGRMTSITFADKSSTKMVYDPKTSRVLKQIGPGTKITTYQYGKSGGMVWTSVEDTQGEKSKYEYIDGEHKTIHTDRNGKKTITTHMACCGKPLSIKDESGKGDLFQYDADGNLISRSNSSGQTTTFKYDPRFSLPSEIQDNTGKSIRYVYDQNGNITFTKASDGAFVKITYEPHGKIATMTDEAENQIRFSYDKIGNPLAIEKLQKSKVLGSLKISYGSSGDVSNVVAGPSGKETVAAIKNTLSSMFNSLKPIGVEFSL